MRRHFKRADLQAVLLTLAGASAVGTGLLVARVAFTGQFLQLYLAWNLFLAWLPLFLSLRAEEMGHGRGNRGFRFWSLCGAWLLFFPNAPYIFTDLIHLTRSTPVRIWTDLVVVLVFALTGLALGFLSLQRMQNLVARQSNRPTGWAFAFAVALLSGFGVYLGRFERWNSWDVILSPLSFAADAVNWFNPRAALFTVLFGVFIFTAHAILHALTLFGAAIHPPVAARAAPEP